MQTDRIMSNIHNFYANLPARVRAKRSEAEWKTVALFIEQNLPQWNAASQARRFKKGPETALPITVSYDPKTKVATIHLERDANIKRNVLYDARSPMVQTIVKEKKDPLIKEFERVLRIQNSPTTCHNDVKLSNIMAPLPRTALSEVPLLDFDFTFNPENAKP